MTEPYPCLAWKPEDSHQKKRYFSWRLCVFPSYFVPMTHKTVSSIGAEIQYRMNAEQYFISLGSDTFFLFQWLSSLWLLCFKAWYLHLVHLVDNFKLLLLFVQWVRFSVASFPFILFIFLIIVGFLFNYFIWFIFCMVMGPDSKIPSWVGWT